MKTNCISTLIVDIDCALPGRGYLYTLVYFLDLWHIVSNHVVFDLVYGILIFY